MRDRISRGIIGLLMASFAAFALPACRSAGASASAKKPEPASPMLERSLLSLGNTARIKAVMKKAKAGQKVIIAAIGGSITEGAGASSPENGWAYLSYLDFKAAYGKGDGGNVEFVNAGMGGTPSTLGMIRFQRDVVAKAGAMPDIVLMEFSVNDGDDPTGGASYDSMARDIMKAPNAPAVINVFAVFKSRWNLQERLSTIGDAYGLPMISVKDAVVPELDAGTLTDDEYFKDIWHPTDKGHRIMADCVAYYFKKAAAAKAEADFPLPAEPALGKQFEGIKMIDAGNPPPGGEIKAGSFSETDQSLGSFFYAPGLRTFPANWHKAPDTANEPLTMTLECKNLLLVYKKSSNKLFGKAEVLVDGEVVNTYDGNPAGSWNNPWTVLILDDAVPVKRIIQVRMAPGSEAKAFSVLAFGYTK
jgi:lysophospholipase L1-like esterase